MEAFCKRCGDSFQPYRDWQTFCSAYCKKTHEREEYRRARAIIERRRSKPKTKKSRPERCQIDSTATVLAKQAAMEFGFKSPSAAIVAALLGHWSRLAADSERSRG